MPRKSSYSWYCASQVPQLTVLCCHKRGGNLTSIALPILYFSKLLAWSSVCFLYKPGSGDSAGPLVNRLLLFSTDFSQTLTKNGENQQSGRSGKHVVHELDGNPLIENFRNTSGAKRPTPVLHKPDICHFWHTGRIFRCASISRNYSGQPVSQ